jgi:hypothetical protein
LYDVEIGEGTASVTDPTLLMEISQSNMRALDRTDGTQQQPLADEKHEGADNYFSSCCLINFVSPHSVETRESLEEAESPAELQSFALHNLSELRRVQRSLSDSFAQRDLDAMRQHTIRLSFLTTIEEEIYKRMPVE